MNWRILSIGILAICLSACESLDFTGDSGQSGGTANDSGNGGGSTDEDGRTVLYVEGTAVPWRQLEQPLLEAAGRQILVETIVDQIVLRQVARRGRRITDAMVEREKQLMLETQSPNPDQAQRLLNELRRRRGLGEARFKTLLRRNAGLRLMVADEVEVTPMMVRQAFEYEYGPRYEARLIVVGNLRKANEVHSQAQAGASFIDLAIEHSTDPSRAQGGLLSPISPVDPTWPAAVRKALEAMNAGEISQPIALENGFAILKLERKIDGQPVSFDDVKEGLAQRVRLRSEKLLMEQRVRALLAEARVVVLDPTLHEYWQEQQKAMKER